MSPFRGTGRRLVVAVLLPLLALAMTGCSRFLRGYAEGRAGEIEALGRRDEALAGQMLFVFDDLGGLNTDTMETHALPWKVVAVALLAQRAEGGDFDLAAVDEVMTGFGFIVPEAVENWRGPAPAPSFRRPLGVVTGTVRRSIPKIEVEVANLGCAGCHAGVTYDARGEPEKKVWLGLPNTSIDLEAYTQAVYRGLKLTLPEKEALLADVLRLFPETTRAELRTLERYVLPRASKRLAELEAGLDAPSVFHHPSPGATNGVAALKLRLGLLADGVRSGEVGYTSIPDLGDRTLRTSLLYDGAYTDPGTPRFAAMERGDASREHVAGLVRTVAFFTVPTMGVRPRAVERAVPRVARVMDFVRAYRPPRFPGRIDRDLARAGSEVYAAHCGECHGDYEITHGGARLASFPNRLSPQEEMGTDPERWEAMDSELVAAIRASGYGDGVEGATTGGYVATPLSGLWATAPYLHNGSVPTLWHLMHPTERPARFLVGGHRLDFEKVGIAAGRDATEYPEGYRPWSTPRLVDTALPGLSNAGHENPFEPLAEADKRALLEFLKLL